MHPPLMTNSMVNNKIAYDPLRLARFRQSQNAATHRNPKIVFEVGDLVSTLYCVSGTDEDGAYAARMDEWVAWETVEGAASRGEG
jgi:hypothetical protein